MDKRAEPDPHVSTRASYVSRHVGACSANEVLAAHPIFGVLSADDREALAAEFSKRTFAAGEQIVAEGEVHAHIYLIESGHAEVYTRKGAKRTVLAQLPAGSLFGEIAALRGIPRTASVCAVDAVQALDLAAAPVRRLLARRPDVHHRINEAVARRVRAGLDELMAQLSG